MKVSITRKDGGSREFECDWWWVLNGASPVLHLEGKDKKTFYACTDWLEVEVVDDSGLYGA